MNKILVTLFLIIIFSVSGFSQGAPQLTKTYPFTSVTTAPAAPGLDLKGLNIGFLKAQWDVYGSGPATVSACTFTVEGSTDGVTWNNPIIQSQSCLTDGQSLVTSLGVATAYIRINVTTFTASFGSPVLLINIAGWNEVTGAATSNPLNTLSKMSGVDSSNVSRTISVDNTGIVNTRSVTYGLPLVQCNPLVRYNCTPKLPFQ